MEKFGLQHTVLYAKGWYKRSNNFWKDIMKCLEADGYLGTFEGESEQSIKHRAVYIILNQFSRIKGKENIKSLAYFFDQIKPHNCWKYSNYWTKQFNFMHSKEEIEKLPEYDIDEAAIKYVLSILLSLNKDEWNPIPPDYKKVLPRKNGIKNKQIEECFSQVS